ncbi:unnamed protein product, partial [marine sediment metagenome]
SYLDQSIITFNYEDIDSLKSIVDNYKNCIDTRATFGDEKSMCYQILTALPSCYEQLLLHNLSNIYIVNREDVIDGGLRELEEESQGIFGKLNYEDVKNCLLFHTNNMITMFIRLDLNMEDTKNLFIEKVKN